MWQHGPSRYPSGGGVRSLDWRRALWICILSWLLPDVPLDDEAVTLRPYVFSAYAYFLRLSARISGIFSEHNAQLRLDLHSKLEMFSWFFYLLLLVLCTLFSSLFSLLFFCCLFLLVPCFDCVCFFLFPHSQMLQRGGECYGYSCVSLHSDS